MSGKRTDLTGYIFGRLTVIERGRTSNDRPGWMCMCVCGTLTTVETTKLKSGHTKSCGCLINEVLRELHKTHGMSGTKVYRTWKSIRGRCYNKNNSEYFRYGARGIKVCKRWGIFENFYKDMGDPPTPDHSIDRIDNNGNYEPSNCRWATPKDQSSNRRSSVFLTYKGETKTVCEWSKLLNILDLTLYSRVKRGWTDEEVLSTPVRKSNRIYKKKQNSI